MCLGLKSPHCSTACSGRLTCNLFSIVFLKASNTLNDLEGSGFGLCAYSTAFWQAAGHIDVAERKVSRQGDDPRASDSQMTLMSHWHCLEHCSPSDIAVSNRWLLSSEPWAILITGRQCSCAAIVVVADTEMLALCRWPCSGSKLRMWTSSSQQHSFRARRLLY